MDTIDTKEKLSRKQFLGVVGSLAATAVLMKFVDSKKALTTVLGEKTSASKKIASYGNHTYGGRVA